MHSCIRQISVSAAVIAKHYAIWRFTWSSVWCHCLFSG